VSIVRRLVCPVASHVAGLGTLALGGALSREARIVEGGVVIRVELLCAQAFGVGSRVGM
jgi:hypothetical protein